jgi:hypothetical protein
MTRSSAQDGDKIAVWFSCGAASAVAAKMTLDQYGGRCSVRVLNNPVAEEDEDNRRFLRDVQEWLGVEIEDVRNSDYPNASAVEVWNRRSAMSFPRGAPCTLELKKRARYEWEESNPVDWHGTTSERSTQRCSPLGPNNLDSSVFDLSGSGANGFFWTNLTPTRSVGR